MKSRGQLKPSTDVLTGAVVKLLFLFRNMEEDAGIIRLVLDSLSQVIPAECLPR